MKLLYLPDNIYTLPNNILIFLDIIRYFLLKHIYVL